MNIVYAPADASEMRNSLCVLCYIILEVGYLFYLFILNDLIIFSRLLQQEHQWFVRRYEKGFPIISFFCISFISLMEKNLCCNSEGEVLLQKNFLIKCFELVMSNFFRLGLLIDTQILNLTKFVKNLKEIGVNIYKILIKNNFKN